MRIGVDLGGTKIEAVILDDAGLPCWRERVPMPVRHDASLELMYTKTLDAIAGLIARAHQAKPAIAGLPVGIGTPGAECADGTLKNCNSVWLNGRTFRHDIEQKLQRPVRIANDANCFALAEARMGAASDANSVFGVILGTGVGGGVVIHQQLHIGSNHIAGEWGHNRLPPQWPAGERSAFEIDEPTSQRACYCGRYNCVETFLSGPGLSRSYQLLSGRDATGQEVASKLAQGDHHARLAWQHYIQQLARALAVVINVIDPEVIVIGGGLSNIPAIYTDLPACWSPYIFSETISTRLVRAKLGDSAGVFGAAWLW